MTEAAATDRDSAPSLPIGGGIAGGGVGALGAGGRLDVVGQVVGVLQEEVFEHAQFLAEQLDLGLEPLVLLLQLVDALLSIHRLLLAAHAALLHRQVVALAALPVLLAVFVCLWLLHLAGGEGLAASGCGVGGDELGDLLQSRDAVRQGRGRGGLALDDAHAVVVSCVECQLCRPAHLDVLPAAECPSLLGGRDQMEPGQSRCRTAPGGGGASETALISYRSFTSADTPRTKNQNLNSETSQIIRVQVIDKCFLKFTARIFPQSPERVTDATTINS